MRYNSSNYPAIKGATHLFLEAFENRHPPKDQERILAEWRWLDITPPLSDIVLHNREHVHYLPS